MFVTLYFPVFDARDFFPERAAKTRRPEWPDTGRRRPRAAAFQRNLGPIVPRPRGGIRGWASEAEVCEIRSSVRVFPGASQAPDVRHLFTRFFSGGDGAAHFSLGFERAPAAPRSSPSQILRTVLDCRLRSKHRVGAGAVDLADAGDLLSGLYATGTSKRAARGRDIARVVAGRPLAVMECDRGEFAALAGAAVQPREAPTDPVLYRSLRSGAGRDRVSAFAIDRSASSPEEVRTRRIVLSRLCVELFAFETCLGVLRGSALDQVDAAGLDVLRSRLADGAKRLTGSQRSALVARPDQYAAMVELFSDLYEPGRVDELVHLLDRLEVGPNLRAAITRAAVPPPGHEILTVNNWMVSMVQEGSKYNVSGSNVGALGDGARAGVVQQSAAPGPGAERLSELEVELARLLAEMRDRARTADQFTSLDAVAEAQEAASRHDGPAVASALGKAGRWALDAATQLGVDVASTALKSALGLA